MDELDDLEDPFQAYGSQFSGGSRKNRDDDDNDEPPRRGGGGGGRRGGGQASQEASTSYNPDEFSTKQMPNEGSIFGKGDDRDGYDGGGGGRGGGGGKYKAQSLPDAQADLRDADMDLGMEDQWSRDFQDSSMGRGPPTAAQRTAAPFTQPGQYRPPMGPGGYQGQHAGQQQGGSYPTGSYMPVPPGYGQAVPSPVGYPAMGSMRNPSQIVPNPAHASGPGNFHLQQQGQAAAQNRPNVGGGGRGRPVVMPNAPGLASPAYMPKSEFTPGPVPPRYTYPAAGPHQPQGPYAGHPQQQQPQGPFAGQYTARGPQQGPGGHYMPPQQGPVGYPGGGQQQYHPQAQYGQAPPMPHQQQMGYPGGSYGQAPSHPGPMQMPRIPYNNPRPQAPPVTYPPPSAGGW
jgi:hypothetical protein